MTVAEDMLGALDAMQAFPIPDAILRVACLHVLDSVGVGLAASVSDVGAPYRRYAQSGPQAGAATVFGMPDGFAPATAAMINGGLIHSLEYDDTHTGSIIHGSSLLSAVALAVGEASGASGRAVLEAYILGWELLVRLGEAAPGGFQAAGFQVTSVAGALVAACVAARLQAMDRPTTLMATGIALSQASGVFEFLSNGSLVKSLHPGWAAHAGVIAADLARCGMTGPLTSIEGRHGLFAAFADDRAAADRFRESLATIGNVWKLADAAFKFHPCCHYIHPFIEATRNAMERTSGDAIASILCRVPRGAAGIICEPWPVKQRPATGHAARWSLPIAIAAQIHHGRVDLDTFAEPASPALLDLAARMSWEKLAQDSFPQRFEAELVFTMRDGSKFVERVEDVYGNAGRPAAESAVREKYRANAGRALAPAQVDALEQSIGRLATAPDLREFSHACRGQRPSTQRAADDQTARSAMTLLLE
jgi:2-methylcitrate dehydratase PrpD